MDSARKALLKRWVPAASLVLGNLVPLVGVVAWGWDVGLLLLLFWSENVVIGIYTILKMLSLGDLMALFFVPFFLLHYGGFLAGHLLFIAGVFLDGGFPPFPFGNRVGATMAGFETLLPVVGIFLLSHGVSFVVHFLLHERKTAKLMVVFTAPYPRIIVLHAAILLGAFAAVALGEPRPAIVILVLMKTGIDLLAHLHEHRPKQAAPTDEPPPAAPAAAPPRPEASSPPGTPSWRRPP